MKIKGFYTSLSEMAKNPCPVNVVMGQDGLYEIRQTAVGVFSVKVEHVEELDNIQEGFILALPEKIPFKILTQIYAFFKKWADKRLEVEAQVFWDTEKQEYFVFIPKQKVTTVSIDLERNVELEAKHVLVLEIHSHHYMPAVFSAIDNNWEKATCLYGVIGNMGAEIPDINLRYSCGGRFRRIKITELFEEYDSTALKKANDYPIEWNDKIEILEKNYSWEF